MPEAPPMAAPRDARPDTDRAAPAAYEPPTRLSPDRSARRPDVMRAPLDEQVRGPRVTKRGRGRVNGTTVDVKYLPARPRKVRKAGRLFFANGMLAPAATYDPLVYNGGPLLSNVELVSLFWGNFTQDQISFMQRYLAGLAGYINGVGAPAGQVPVLWQYQCVCAHVGASFADPNVPASGSGTDADVQNEVIALQNAGSLPAFAPDRLFLVFTSGISFPGYGDATIPNGWCGYHNDWGSGQYYALCPLPTATAACFSDDLSAWESVTSHEVMEAMTDPHPFSGWDNSTSSEGGDPCNFQENALAFGTVQSFDDNSQKTCAIYTPAAPAFWVKPFSPWAGYAIPNGLWLVGDFSGDGRADIVHAVQDTDYVNVWTSLGRAQYDVRQFIPWSGYAIPNGLWLVGDFDGDGKSDIVHAVQDTDYVNVWLSNGDSTFRVDSFSPWSGYSIPNGLWLVGDFDGDGKADIVHAVQDTDYVNVWTSNGDGTFRVNSFRPWSGYAIPNGLWLVGDFNGDGRSDILHVVNGGDTANVWLSNGDGTFSVTPFRPWPGYAMPNGLWLVGDFDGDGRSDVVHAVQDTDYVNVWLSNGDGTFRVNSFSPWGGYAIPNGLWMAGDFDGDGRADIVHAVQGADYVNEWLSNGDGTFAVRSYRAWSGYAIPNGLWLPGDYNGDGRMDIVHAVQDTDYVNTWTSLYAGFQCSGQR